MLLRGEQNQAMPEPRGSTAKRGFGHPVSLPILLPLTSPPGSKVTATEKKGASALPSDIQVKR